MQGRHERVRALRLKAPFHAYADLRHQLDVLLADLVDAKHEPDDGAQVHVVDRAHLLHLVRQRLLPQSRDRLFHVVYYIPCTSKPY